MLSMLSSAHRLALVFACACAASAQSPDEQGPSKVRRNAKGTSLLLIENVIDPKDSVCRKRRLVRYRFRGARAPVREVIVEREQRFFGHFGGARLARGRYVVTKFGGVIDLDSKKVVHDEQLGELLGIDGDHVIYRVENVYRENGVFAFDLAKRKLHKLREPHTWLPRSVRSKDGKHCASSNMKGEVWLHDAAGKRRRLAEGLTLRLSMFSSDSFQGVPMLWLDNKTLLTQVDNGQLITLTTDGQRKDLADINNPPEPVICPYFRRDAAGRIIYVCDKSYVVDPAARSVKLSRWRAAGNGFDFARDRDPEHGQIIRENGREIGREPVVSYNAVSAPGRLAIGVATKKSPGYVKAVKTWDSTSMSWKKIDLWLNQLIGWTTERRR